MRERLSEEEFVKNLAEFEALAKELKMPYSVPRWEFDIIGANGLIEGPRFHSQSWTRNNVNLTCYHFCSVKMDTSGVTFGDGELNVKEYDGTIQTISTNQRMIIDAAVDDDTLGIILGSGSGAEGLDNFDLTTLIDNGRAAGELQYYSMDESTDFQYYAWDSVARKFVYTTWRYFLNDSGGNVTVAEAGIVVQVISGGVKTLLVIRDVLSSAVVVPDLNLLLVRYIVESAVYP